MVNYLIYTVEWKEYKAAFPETAIHFGEPKEFPCIIFSHEEEFDTDVGKQIDIHHDIIYVEEAEKLVKAHAMLKRYNKKNVRQSVACALIDTSYAGRRHGN